jgi:hypothetical protein
MNFNPWAVLVAAASSFLLGGLWYGKVLFGPAWGRAAGITATTEKHGHPARVFGISFLFSLIAATVFAHRLGPSPELWLSVKSGFIVGTAWVATCFGINYQFADRSPLLWLIDGGYHTAQFVLFGLVLGLWH